MTIHSKTTKKKQKNNKRNPPKTRSLCFSCKRAYAKPFEEGGCEKFLYGEPVYKRAVEIIKEPDRKKQRSYTVLVVQECDYYECDYLNKRNMREG